MFSIVGSTNNWRIDAASAGDLEPKTRNVIKLKKKQFNFYLSVKHCEARLAGAPVVDVDGASPYKILTSVVDWVEGPAITKEVKSRRICKTVQ